MKPAGQRLVRTSLFASALIAIPCTMAWAGAHTWRVNEIFSNADGTIQFVELRECCGGAFETGAPGHNVTSNSRSFLMTGNPLTPPTSNRTILLATPAFAALPGAPTPDYVFPASMVPFFSINGDTLQYFPYDALTFGAGALPHDGIHSLGAGAVIACNSPTNYAGQTGSVNAGCTLQGDVDGNGILDGADVAAFVRVRFGQAGTGDVGACAEFCTGSLAGDVSAFVTRMLAG